MKILQNLHKFRIQWHKRWKTGKSFKGSIASRKHKRIRGQQVELWDLVTNSSPNQMVWPKYTEFAEVNLKSLSVLSKATNPSY